MDIESITRKLQESHSIFISYLSGLTKEEFLSSKNEKWTAGQQLQHIYLSVKPVRQIMALPLFIPELIWGQANRPSKSYEDLVKKYLLKLGGGVRARGRFAPKSVSIEKGERLKIDLKNEVNRLVARLDKLSEEELDKFIIPHPLLGKLTMREMLYFTIHHVEHHQQLTKRNLTL